MTRLARQSFAAFVLVAVAALGSCSGEVGVVGTGESHFLRSCETTCARGYECLCGVCTRLCSKTRECTSLGETVECVSQDASSCGEEATKTCDVQCSSAKDCTWLGEEFECTDGACRARTTDAGEEPASRCDAGCTEITAYPEDESLVCAKLDAPKFLGCSCDGSATVSRCMHRNTDDTYWLVVGGAPTPTESWSDCMMEQRGSPFDYSCDFAECEVAPNSLCSVEQTCSAVGCGTGELDSHGCVNPRCRTDADCADTERCVIAPVESDCTPKANGRCECFTGKDAIYDQFCNPVSAVGERGAWQTVTTVQGIGSCTTTDSCTTRTVTPDGKVVASDGSSWTLEDLSLQRIVRIVDGPDFRVEMADGFDCNSPPPGAMDWVRFETENDEFEQAVTGCILNGPAGNDAATLFELLAEP